MTPEYPFSGAQLVEILDWYDAPLLSIYKQGLTYFIHHWCDAEDTGSAFISTYNWVETNPHLVVEYLTGECSLLKLFQESPNIWQECNGIVTHVKFKDMREDHLPTAKAFYTEAK